MVPKMNGANRSDCAITVLAAQRVAARADSPVGTGTTLTGINWRMVRQVTRQLATGRPLPMDRKGTGWDVGPGGNRWDALLVDKDQHVPAR